MAARPPDRLRLAEGAASAAAAVLALALHLRFFLHAGALWRDEADTLGFAPLRYSTYPAVYAELVRLWTAAAGGSDRSLRVWGLLAGAALLAALWAAVRARGPRAPALCVALLGLSPAFVRAEDYLRPYGLGLCALLIAWILLWRLAEAPSGRRALLAAAACALSVQLLYQNAAAMLAIAICAPRRGRAWALAAAGAGLVSLLPYFGPAREARAMYSIMQGPVQSWPVAAALGGGLAALAWLGALALAARTALEDERVRPEALLALAGPAALCAVVAASRFDVQPRYLLPPAAVAAVCLDVVLGRGDALARRARVGLTLAAAALLAPIAWDDLARPQTNVDAIASALERAAGPRDLVVVDKWYYGVSFQRYYHGAAPWTTLPPVEPDSRFHRPDEVRRAMAAPDAVGGVLKRAETTLRAGGRVWVVGDLVFAPRLAPPGPAPLPDTGWWSGPYLASWSTELERLLRSHGARAVRGRPPLAQDVENLQALGVDGWR